MNGTTMQSPRRSGFTIAELMVVVAIIGTLVALLLPAVTGAFALADRLSCQANMRAIAAAVRAYAASNGGAVVPSGITTDFDGTTFSTDTMPTWSVILVKDGFIGAPNTTVAKTSRFTVSTRNVFRCPAGADALGGTRCTPDTGDPGPQGFWRTGTVSTSGGFPAYKVDCWYYWNGSLKEATSGDTDDVPSAVLGAAKVRGYVDAIRHPTQTVMLADGYGFNAHNEGNGVNQIVGRHSGEHGTQAGTNVAYYDGHVEMLQRNRDPNAVGDAKDPLVGRTGLHSTEPPFFRLSDQH